MASDATFKGLKNAISLALIDTTRTAGQISNEDLAFQRSSNPSIVPLLEQQNLRLLGLAQRLTRSASLGTEVTDPHIVNADSIENKWKVIVDVVDSLLEKADACLDEYSGVIKKSIIVQEEKRQEAVPALGKQKPSKAHRTQNIAKPQLLFDNVPTNDKTSPFKPLLRMKPNAIVTLDESLKLVAAEDGSKQYVKKILLSSNDALPPLKVDTHTRYNHPYETEIKISQYPASIRVKADPIPFSPYESSEAVLVDTPKALCSMLDELRLAKEIAVDLEHHDEHSYIGLVSLMQISTRNRDWIIDTLKPWREKLQILNEVFTDPKILKVFHGSTMDMIWLQRDFGLPIPEEMFNYARSDTHFLLYIYDNMRNELIDKSNTSLEDGDLIEVVIERSKEETLQRYERPFYDTQRGSGPMGWYNMLCRTPALFNREQFAVFRAVHQWRDQIAREEDESVHVIMPKHVLYNLARELPLDMPSLLGCSHPISQSFKTRKSEILAVIRKAKMLSHEGPEMKEYMHTMQPLTADRLSKVNGTDRAVPALSSARTALTPLPKRNSSRMPIESKDSRFWGSTIPNDMDRRAVIQASRECLCLALPLPQLTAEIFVNTDAAGADAHERPQTSPGARAEHPFIKDRRPKDDEIFVVKEAGGSRKRKATDSYDSPDAVYSKAESNAADHAQRSPDKVDKPPVIDDQEHQDQNTKTTIATKEEKRARRLESKRLKKEGLGGNGDARSQRPGEVEPFDYANAPSVLHASNSSRRVAGKEINPYTKSSNAPKGMRRAKKEQEGKSFTFVG